MPSQNESFTFIDLFAGIGGFKLGFTAAGAKCVFANEWDKHAAKTYEHWYGSGVDTRDLREIDPAEIPDHDVLAAGFPCQPFSLAGVSKKNSLGREHGFKDLDQGNLFFAICDVIRAKQPKVLVLENVKNLKSHDRGNTWSVIQATLEDLGYEVVHKVIDARPWVPQHRERIFIVAFRRNFWSASEIASFRFPTTPNSSLPVLGDILDSHENFEYMITERLWEYLQEYAAKHKEKGNGFGFSIANKDSHSRTLSARYHKDGSEILIQEPGWPRPRKLSPVEARRLMGFTEQLGSRAGLESQFPQVVSDTQAYKQFGNSVCPEVTRLIAKEILDVLRISSSG